MYQSKICGLAIALRSSRKQKRETESCSVKAYTIDLIEPDRMCKLKYLANLLEDTFDFSFENAKACDAVVVTDMERDKLI